MTADVRNAKQTPVVIMIGTGLDTMGGISTVVRGYIAAGLFERVPIVYVKTHCDGSLLRKLKVAATGLGQFLRTLATRNVHLVHIHLSSRSSFWRKLPFALTTKLTRKPLILHLHGSEFMTFYHHECGPVRKRIVEYVFDHSDTIIALSPQWAQDISEITDNTNIRVILNRVPVADGLPARSATDNPCPRILFLGRLGHRKGIYDLLNALKIVRDRGTEFRLTAAGDGEIERVSATARELGLEKYVTVPGWIDEQGRNELLKEADIFVLPSHAEGLPMSLLEAMAAGLPVVASSVGGIPNAVESGVEGLIVSPGDVDNLAIALDSLLRNRELRAALGEKANEKARNEFDVRQSVSEVIDVYSQYGKV